MGKRNTLWMRYVDFAKVKDIMRIIDSNESALRAIDLERIGIANKIFINSEGKPYSHSTRYHYRKVMENLGIVNLIDGRYHLKKSPAVERILNDSKMGENLTLEDKEAFWDLIINNLDCRTHYFNYFFKDDVYDAKLWASKGTPVRIETKTNIVPTREQMKNSPRYWVRIINDKLGKINDLYSYDSISAVMWGVRRWATELGMTEEYVLSSRTGRIIFPLSQEKNHKERLRKALIELLNDSHSQGSRYILSIPELIANISELSRTKTEYAKQYIVELKSRFPSEIRFIKTSRAMAVHASSYQRQDHDLIKLYLREVKENGSQAFLSNIVLQEKIIKHL